MRVGHIHPNGNENVLVDEYDNLVHKVCQIRHEPYRVGKHLPHSSLATDCE